MRSLSGIEGSRHTTSRRSRRLTLFLLALGVALGLPACREEARTGAGAEEKAPKARYVCPMHPQVVSDRKGTCPICNMDLVLQDGGDAPPTPASAAGPPDLAAVTIDPERRQQIGLKTVRVDSGPISATIRATGRVAYDETRVHHVHTKFEGYVEMVWANFVGAYVEKGQPLFSIYSPELFAAQQEYLLALRARKSLASSGVPDAERGGADLLAAARQRLLFWDLTEKDIVELEERGTPSRTLVFRVPVSGYVMAKTATHGMKVTPMDSLFDIVDLSSVWVLADVFESELPRVFPGQQATMTLSYLPGREWRGRVTYVFPTLDEKTRTGRVRLEFGNPAGQLKPEMFARVVLEGVERRVVRVPDDAVIDSGVRKIVFVALGEGRLSPREVTTGEHEGGFFEVIQGLSEGEEVALGASFLVDSESRLKAALGTLAPASTEPQASTPGPEPGPKEGRPAAPRRPTASAGSPGSSHAH